MSIFFRKTIKLGPIHINFTKSGVGISIGVPGARIGRSPAGRTYVSGGLPGSRVNYRKNLGTRKKKH